MSIDERNRIALHEAARDSWGPEIAGTLMEMLPPGGWAEVATKSDLAVNVAALRSDLAVNVAALKSDLAVNVAALKSDIAALKAESATKSDLEVFASELRVEMAGLGATLERGLRTQLQWTFTMMIGLAAFVTAISGFTR